MADAAGKPIPISRLMLHHIVFLNLARRDNTCGSFTNWDSLTKLPAAERFYGGGEERSKMILPPGYGYRVRPSDPWILNYMFMNHRNRVDKAYIKYRITYDTDPSLKAVKPYWLDVKNCLADPVFDVPGGGRRGSTFRKSPRSRSPRPAGWSRAAGTCTAGRRTCGAPRRLRQRRIYSSKPTWGSSRHPFYRVRPILHEPGPINMTGFNSAKGIPVAAGERLRLDASYDNRYVHTRVMGISVAYLAPDDSVTAKCGATAGRHGRVPPAGGQAQTPRFKVPIVGMRRGRARDISAPPGGACACAAAPPSASATFLQEAERGRHPGRAAALALHGPDAAQRDGGQRAARLLVDEPLERPRLQDAAVEAGHVPALLRPAPREA